MCVVMMKIITYHLVDPCVAEIENIKEEIIDDESDNESIVSLINQSLTNSDDDSIDEEL